MRQKLLRKSRTHFVLSRFFFPPKIVPFFSREKILYSGAGYRWQYGACALHAGYIRLQIHTLRFHNTHATAKSTKRIAFGADQPSAFRLPWLRSSVIFLSCKANARVYDAKSGYGPHSPLTGPVASSKHLTKVAFATEPVWAQNPDSHPTKVYPIHN